MLGMTMCLSSERSVGSWAPAFAPPVAPYAYYGVVRLSTYDPSLPCVDVIRASDSATLTVGFVRNVIDIGAISAFGAGTTVSVTQWYDQSVNSFHATQAVGASQPTISPALVLNGLPAIHHNQQFFDLPAGVSTTQNAVSGFMVGRSFSGFFGSGWMSLGATTPLYTMANVSNNFRFGDFGATPNFGSENPYDVRLLSFLSGASNTVRLNEVVHTITAGGANAITGGQLGRYSVGAGTTALNDMMSFAVFNSALSAANHTATRNALYLSYAIYSTLNGPLICWDGDSITTGSFNSFRSYVDPAMTELRVQARCISPAQTGETLALMVTNYPSRVAPMFSAGSTKNIASVFGGTNDIGANVSAATCFNSLLAYAAAARLTGYKVVVSTMLPRNSGFSGGQTAGGFETARLAFNASIAADALAHWDAVADFASDPIMGNMANVNNSAYYLTALHPTDLGNSLLGPYAATAANTLL